MSLKKLLNSVSQYNLFLNYTKNDEEIFFEKMTHGYIDPLVKKLYLTIVNSNRKINNSIFENLETFKLNNLVPTRDATIGVFVNLAVVTAMNLYNWIVMVFV